MSDDPIAIENDELAEQGDEKRERSTIVFPYNDLRDAIAVAQAMWDNVGAGNCDLAQLAAWLQHDSATSGAFRLKVAASRTFGLTNSKAGSYSLTRLGRDIVDPQKAAQAKVEAFLTVPLYREIHQKYSGILLPNAVGLEREMADLGVAAKQTDKARQAFQRSAQEAGFFKEGNNKLVRPAFATRPDDGKSKVEQNGGGDGGPPTMHPFIKGLVETLPPAYTEWSDDKQDEWIAAAKAIFRIIYPGGGKAIVPSAPQRPSELSPTDAQD